jgi:hypothetical protein
MVAQLSETRREKGAMGRYKGYREVAQWNTCKVADDIEDVMAQLHDLQQALGTISRDARIQFRPRRDKATAPGAEPDAA